MKSFVIAAGFAFRRDNSSPGFVFLLLCPLSPCIAQMSADASADSMWALIAKVHDPKMAPLGLEIRCSSVVVHQAITVAKAMNPHTDSIFATTWPGKCSTVISIDLPAPGRCAVARGGR